MKNYTLTADQNVNGKFTLEFLTPNKNGETMTAEFYTCIGDLKNKNSLMNLWIKNGYIKTPLKTYWSIDTNVYNTLGECRRKYDPTIAAYTKISRKNNKTLENRLTINFDYILEATSENMQILINEITKRFYNCIPTEHKTEYI